MIVFNKLEMFGKAKKLNDLILDEDFKSNMKLESRFSSLKQTYKNIEIENQGMDLGNCKLLKNTPYIQPKIDCQGNVFLCRSFSELRYSIGNVNNESINQILFGDAAIREICYLKDLKNNSICEKCFITHLCNGGCIAHLNSLDSELKVQNNSFCELRRKFWMRKLGVNNESA